MGCGFSAELCHSTNGSRDRTSINIARGKRKKSGPDALSSAHQPSAPNSTTREPSVTTATVLIASEVIGTLSMDGGVVSGFLL